MHRTQDFNHPDGAKATLIAICASPMRKKTADWSAEMLKQGWKLKVVIDLAILEKQRC